MTPFCEEATLPSLFVDFEFVSYSRIYENVKELWENVSKLEEIDRKDLEATQAKKDTLTEGRG